MSFAADLQQDFSGTLVEYGELCRLKYYQDSFSGADYDNRYLNSSGLAQSWVFGMHFPIDSRTGGEDFKFLQQGRIQLSDKKLYVDPSVNLSGAAVKIGLGSPVRAEYCVLEDGVIVYEMQGTSIYKKAYIRLLSNGSFANEVA